MPGKFLVGVSAIIERDTAILLLQRSATKDHGAGEWEFVSGRVESGESALEAVKREIAEETSLQVEVLFPFDTFSFLRGEAKEELIGITFLCRYVGGELQLTEEHGQGQWVSTEQVLHMELSQPIRATFMRYLDFKGGFSSIMLRSAQHDG
jgi:8-oxo-dGTP diphosphatase